MNIFKVTATSSGSEYIFIARCYTSSEARAMAIEYLEAYNDVEPRNIVTLTIQQILDDTNCAMVWTNERDSE